jgi:hypothetical protein
MKMTGLIYGKKMVIVVKYAQVRKIGVKDVVNILLEKNKNFNCFIEFILCYVLVLMEHNGRQLYLVADFENKNFKLRQNEIRRKKHQ